MRPTEPDVTKPVARPRVDVGIVTWNTRELTLDAVDRLLAASTDVDLRVLLRDNGSTDGTAEAVGRRFPEIEVDVGANVGFACGVNTLLARSDAPWFLTLNSDAWPEQGAVRRLVEVASAHPRAAAVAPLLRRPEGAVEPSAHDLPSLAGALRTALRPVRQRVPPHAHEVGWAVGAAVLLRRPAVDALGGFDASFFMYAEDLEWCWRARRAGWQVWLAPDAVVRHIGNASGAQRWGTSREQVAIANANAVTRRYLGRVKGNVWRSLNAAGAVRAGAFARSADLRRFYWRQVPAHLGILRDG